MRYGDSRYVSIESFVSSTRLCIGWKIQVGEAAFIRGDTTQRVPSRARQQCSKEIKRQLRRVFRQAVDALGDALSGLGLSQGAVVSQRKKGSAPGGDSRKAVS